MLRFAVRPAYLERHPMDPSGGYRFSAGDLEDLTASLAGAIVEEADYRGPVADQEFAAARAALGRELPPAWRAYLQGPSWFRRGWLDSGAYVWLNTPREMLDLHDAWDESTVEHPGIAIIGGDGSRDQLVLDLRQDPAPVLLVDITSSGWETATRQAGDVAELVGRIEACTFDFR